MTCCLIYAFCLFLDRISQYSSGWPGTQNVHQGGFKLTSAGIKGVSHYAQPLMFILYYGGDNKTKSKFKPFSYLSLKCVVKHDTLTTSVVNYVGT